MYLVGLGIGKAVILIQNYCFDLYLLAMMFKGPIKWHWEVIEG